MAERCDACNGESKVGKVHFPDGSTGSICSACYFEAISYIKANSLRVPRSITSVNPDGSAADRWGESWNDPALETTGGDGRYGSEAAMHHPAKQPQAGESEADNANRGFSESRSIGRSVSRSWSEGTSESHNK